MSNDEIKSTIYNPDENSFIVDCLSESITSIIAKEIILHAKQRSSWQEYKVKFWVKIDEHDGVEFTSISLTPQRNRRFEKWTTKMKSIIKWLTK